MLKTRTASVGRSFLVDCQVLWDRSREPGTLPSQSNPVTQRGFTSESSYDRGEADLRGCATEGDQAWSGAIRVDLTVLGRMATAPASTPRPLPAARMATAPPPGLARRLILAGPEPSIPWLRQSGFGSPGLEPLNGEDTRAPAPARSDAGLGSGSPPRSCDGASCGRARLSLPRRRPVLRRRLVCGAAVRGREGNAGGVG